MTYKTTGTCATEIKLAVDDGIISGVEFVNGCSGNLQGISRLAIGRTPAEIMDVLAGIKCKSRGTSCPDQLSLALRAVLQAGA